MQAFADRAALNETLQTRQWNWLPCIAYAQTNVPLNYSHKQQLTTACLLIGWQPFIAALEKGGGAKARHLVTISRC